MTVGFVQTNPVFGDPESNFREILDLTRNTRADLLVLPELFASGYTFVSADEALSLAEPREGRTAAFLMEIAQEIGGHVVGGFPELAADGAVYNASLLVSSQNVVGVYRKIHLFNREKLWFTPGNQAPRVHDIGPARVGMMICFDWIFPETARTLALSGADILAHPSNLVLPYCQDAMVTRCLENRVFAVTANRVGSEERGPDRFSFTGSSQITGWDGSVLSRGGQTESAVALVEIDPVLARDKRLNAYNQLMDDRRADLYRLSGPALS